MKESYSEGLASRADPELYAGGGNIAGVATTGARIGWVLSSEMRDKFVCRPDPECGKATSIAAIWQVAIGHDGVEDPSMYGTSKHENREILSVSCDSMQPPWKSRNDQRTSPTERLI